MNVHGLEITDYEASDHEMLDDIIPEGIQINKIIADGGYYSIEQGERLYRKGIIPVIVPPAHAVVHAKPTTSWHDKAVQYIKDKGSVYAFHKKYDYNRRSLVEAQISRIKRCIGPS